MQALEEGRQETLDSPALLHVSQHLLGSGDDMGTWMLELINPRPGSRALLACTATMIPWFLQAWFHTLQVFVDNMPVPLDQVRIQSTHPFTCLTFAQTTTYCPILPLQVIATYNSEVLQCIVSPTEHLGAIPVAKCI
jgi:hypothetical protein